MIWLQLLCRLQVRGLINPFPEQALQDLSIKQLVNLTKRCVHGPLSWATHSSSPAIAHQIVLHPSLPSEDILQRERAVLLPGGRFVLFTHSGKLKCWSVIEDRLIWEYRSHKNLSCVREFAAEIVEKGQAAMIVIGVWVMHTECVLSFIAVLNIEWMICRNLYAEVVHIDFSLERSHSVLLHEIVGSAPIGDNPTWYLRICSDFVVIMLLSNERRHEDILFLRLSTQSHCSFPMAAFRILVCFISHL